MDLSPSCPETKRFFNLFNEGFAANRNALGPFGSSAIILILYRSIYPLEMGFFQLLLGFKSQQ